MGNEKHRYRGIENVVPPNRVARWAWEKIARRYIENIEIDGRVNLDQARQLAGENNTGIIFVGNHLSNADWFVFKDAMKQSGFDNDPDGGFVPILGIRLYRHPITRLAVYSAPHVKIWPPTEVPITKEDEAKAMKMNMAALRTHRKTINNGLNTLIFPQGGREDHEITRKPAQQLAGFFESGVILPFGMLADGILRKGQWRPKRNTAYVNFGKPFMSKDIDNIINELPKDKRRQEKVMFVMTQVAKLLPEDYRGIFSERVKTLNLFSNRDVLSPNIVTEKANVQQKE